MSALTPEAHLRVTAALAVVHAARREHGDDSGVVPLVQALEAAGLLASPETAAELNAYRSLDLGTVGGRVSAWCPDPEHPTWLRAPDDTRTCPWCYIAGLQTVLATNATTINRLMADQSADLPRLRADVTAWSQRGRAAEAAQAGESRG